MGRIKLNLKQLPISEKIAKARQIIAALTGNAHFTTPTPALAAIKTAADDLEVATADVQAARQAVKTKTSTQTQKEDGLDQLLNQLSAYVESVAGTDDTLIHSAGMDTRAKASASTTPRQPQSLSATAGKRDSEIALSWDKVDGAKSYIVEQSLDPPTATSWAHAGVSTKARTTISGLTTGTRYWFRVTAVGAIGQSGSSDPATMIAP